MELRAVGVEQALSVSCNSTQHARNSFWLLPQIRVIVNKKPLNLEKTISSVLSSLWEGISGLKIEKYFFIVECIRGARLKDKE